MKHAKWLVVVMVVVLSGLATAQLRSNSKIVAQVPFDFMVANTIVPAGECAVEVATMDGKILLIRNADSNVSLFSRSFLTEGKQGSSGYALVFKRYGDRYFLSGIELEGSKIAYRLPESKVEAELRAQNAVPTEEVLLASLR
jgi:hypothetical protein